MYYLDVYVENKQEATNNGWARTNHPNRSLIFSNILTVKYAFAEKPIIQQIMQYLQYIVCHVTQATNFIHLLANAISKKCHNTILGFTPRLLLASFTAYLVGEFINSLILAKLKIVTRGRWIWTRTIDSTLVGEGIDTIIFILVAFWGIIPSQLILTTILTQWIFKVLYEILATPFTYLMVGLLKKQENLDTYDYHTNFSPFFLQKDNVRG